MQNLVKLESVGSVIDLNTEIVYPQGVHIYKVSDEWFDSLDDIDIQTLIDLGIYEILK